MKDNLSKFKSELAKRHEENSNLIKEIRALTDAAIQNQGASMKTLEIRIGQMSKVLQEKGFGSLPSSTEANLRDQNRTLMYEKRQTKILFLGRLNGYYCNEKKGSYGPQFSEAYSEASHINNSIPRKEKYLGNFAVLENMDAYRDEGMGDVIFGEPFLVKIGVSTTLLSLATDFIPLLKSSWVDDEWLSSVLFCVACVGSLDVEFDFGVLFDWEWESCGASLGIPLLGWAWGDGEGVEHVWL
ncbi:hypothetical protein Tco_0058334 [Tanacetum coccineum]